MKVVLWKIVGSMSDPFHKEMNEVTMRGAPASPGLLQQLAEELEMGANMAPGEVQELHLVLVVEA